MASKKSKLRYGRMKRELKGHGAGRWGPTATGEFSTANPKGFIEQTIHAKKSIPGSAHYKPRSIRPKLGSKFSSSFPKNDVDWKIYTAKKIPGVLYTCFCFVFCVFLSRP